MYALRGVASMSERVLSSETWGNLNVKHRTLPYLYLLLLRTLVIDKNFNTGR